MLSACTDKPDDILDSQSLLVKLEADPLFKEWSTTRNANWFPYVMEKAGRDSITRERVFESIKAAVTSLRNAQEFYEIQLFEKYKEKDRASFRADLESLYEKVYKDVNLPLTSRSMLNEWYSAVYQTSS